MNPLIMHFSLSSANNMLTISRFINLGVIAVGMNSSYQSYARKEDPFRQIASHFRSSATLVAKYPYSSFYGHNRFHFF